MILNGHTGTGKTAILRRLQSEGYPIVDLESMADHRGSIFGHVGQRTNNQKTFEALLLEQLLKLQDAPFIVMEGESKRIGKAVLPRFMVEKKEAGTQIFIELPIEERVRHILEDYQPAAHKGEILHAFKRIKTRIHTPIAKEIEANLLIGHYDRAVRLLLEHYYDPRYEHAMSQYEKESHFIQAQTIDEAVDAVKRILPEH
jgi:tRNA 2-selenouridine synthase